MAMPYFSHLKTFVTVYRCGSHNKASEILGLTQPAISKRIAALETQIGKLLFYKDGPKRHEATEVAHALARELAPHIDQIEQIFNAYRVNAPELQGTVYIGGQAEFVEEHLTQVIAALATHHIKFILQTEKGKDWLRLLDNHSLDMAIIPSTIDSEVIGFRELLTDDLVLIIHESLCGDAVDIHNLVQFPFIEHNEELPCIRHYLASLPIDHTMLTRSASVGSFRMVKDIVMSGAGFSIIPRHFVQEELSQGSLREIALSGDPPRLRLYLAWNKFALRKPRNLFVRDAILESIQSWGSVKNEKPDVIKTEL